MNAPDRYVVVGNPVAHSQSPFIHACFARETGEAVDYGRLLCPLGPPGAPDEPLAEALRRFAAGTDADGETDTETDPAGRSPGRGCNITVPFKFAAFQLASRSSERAALAQAANVLRFDRGADGRDDWLADNTDGAGLVRDIGDNAGVALGGRRVLLIGAGGAAAGALGPLLGARPAQLAVVNRTFEHAAELARRHGAHAALHGVELLALPLDAAGAGYDVVVNASASSLAGDAVPVSPQVLRGAAPGAGRPGTLALDMMYGAPARPFLQWAEAHGAQGRDGLGMLVEQAAEAFRLWRGVRPRTAGVLHALRERLAAA